MSALGFAPCGIDLGKSFPEAPLGIGYSLAYLSGINLINLVISRLSDGQPPEAADGR